METFLGWAVLAMGAAALVGIPLWARWRFDAVTRSIISDAQSDFAQSAVDVHSVTAVRALSVDGETAILYHIDATIAPSCEGVTWSAADLFLRGADGDPNQVGDVVTAKRWNGEAFVPWKNAASLDGTQRLLLSIRFAGRPGHVRFNFNFASFGSAFSLPELEVVSA